MQCLVVLVVLVVILLFLLLLLELVFVRSKQSRQIFQPAACDHGLPAEAVRIRPSLGRQATEAELPAGCLDRPLTTMFRRWIVDHHGQQFL
jgi:hypothetical protein